MVYVIMGCLSIAFASIYSKNKKIVWYLLLVFPLILVSSIRLDIGTDYSNYEYTFYRTWGNGHLEFIYIWLQNLVRYVFGDYKWMIAITSIIFVLVICRAIVINSCNYALSIFLLLTGTFYFESMSHIRFMIGVAFVLFSYRYIKEKKFWLFLIIIFIAAGFHKACILASVMYFLYNPKIKWYFILLISVIMIGLIRFIPVIIEVIPFFLNYKIYFTDTDEGAVFLGGLLIINAIIFAFYIFLIKIYKINGEEVNIFLNAEIIACTVALFSSLIPLAGRVATLFEAFLIISLPYMIEAIPKSKDKVIIKLIVVTTFFLYCLYSIVLQKGFGVWPYQHI